MHFRAGEVRVPGAVADVRRHIGFGMAAMTRRTTSDARSDAPFSFRLLFEGNLKGNSDPFQKEQATRFIGNERKKGKDRGWTV